MYNLIEEIEERGIDLGKKISIYEAHQRGVEMAVLTLTFALSSNKILEIVEEMKKRERLRGNN